MHFWATVWPHFGLTSGAYLAGTEMPGVINKTDGRRVGGTFDFRNQSVVEWFINDYVGGKQCIGNPNIDGWFADDVYGLGSPGSPDKTPTVAESGMNPEQVSSPPNPHLILTSSSPSSSPHPHLPLLTLAFSSPHPHLILTASSPHPHKPHLRLFFLT